MALWLLDNIALVFVEPWSITASYWNERLSRTIDVDVVISGSRAEKVIASNNSLDCGKFQGGHRPAGSSSANHNVFGNIVAWSGSTLGIFGRGSP